MLEINQTTNVNGIVKVKEDTETKQVAFLSASVNVDGNFTSNKTVQNAEMFKIHKEEVEEDFSAFDIYVYGIAAEARKNWEDAKKKSEEPDAESTQ